jgi:O-acetyl-ADP-ribose deacetylase (regulator of RNase III)
MWRVGDLTIQVLQGDLTTQQVDAIVNAANNDLQLGGGVAGAIARAGGPQIQEECDRIGRIELGEAAMTSGGRLPARHVIHAASMRLGSRTTAENLRRSTARSLELASQHGLHSIAFPAIGTGIARFPMEECARVMVEEVAKRARNKSSLTEVRFVLYGVEAEAAFRKEAERQLT